MSKKRNRPDPAEFTPDRYTEFQSNFKGEPDRVTGLLAGVFLENSLEEMILARLVDSDISKALLYRRDGSAPLGTFATRIKTAFALGLLPEEMYHNLEAIRAIRNKFAHSHEKLTFESPEIQEEFAKASAVKEGLPASDGSRVPFSAYRERLSRRPDGSHTDLTEARLGFLLLVFMVVSHMRDVRKETKKLEIPKCWQIVKDKSGLT